jgi:hypothetical protein
VGVDVGDGWQAARVTMSRLNSRQVVYLGMAFLVGVNEQRPPRGDGWPLRERVEKRRLGLFFLIVFFDLFGDSFAELADALTQFGANFRHATDAKDQQDDSQDDDEFCSAQVRHFRLLLLLAPHEAGVMLDWLNYNTEQVGSQLAQFERAC